MAVPSFYLNAVMVVEAVHRIVDAQKLMSIRQSRFTFCKLYSLLYMVCKSIKK